MMATASAPSSRSERKLETRRSLIQAAREVIADKGFANASLADIAERAGVTTGAIYSNFRSKEALLLHVVEARVAELFPDLVAGEDSRDASTIVDDLVRLAVRSARFTDTAESRQLVALQIEVFLIALRDPSFIANSGTIEDQRASSARLGRLIESLESTPNPGPPPRADLLGALFYAALQGLQQNRLINPELAPDESFEWCVKALLYAAVQGRQMTAATRTRPVSASRRASRRG